MIESRLPELRQRLEAAGVSVQSFDIATDPNANGSRNPSRDAATEFAPRMNREVTATAARRPRSAPAGTLDVTV
jgi:hypothetical protein